MTSATGTAGTGLHFSRSAIQGGFWYKAYDVVYAIAVLMARLIALFNRKLSRALKGKQGGVGGWQIGAVDERKCVLLHVASYGEFEGIIPLIERLQNTGKFRIAVSYSSPSAEKTVNALPGIWARGYLPYDFLHRQLRFLARIAPAAVLISKHDFWPNMLRAAKALAIPAILINANFHPGSRRTLPIVRSFHRTFMKNLTAIWTVSKADAERIEPLLSVRTKLLAVGDTRYDRVRQRANAGRERFSELKEALKPGPVFIAGSSWQPGEKICWAAFASIVRDRPDAKLIVVPHEPTVEALERNRAAASAYDLNLRLFSEWSDGRIEEQVLLVDMVGVLADLYAVGWAAYVGGGFGRGVHSVIEPAAHGLPVAFGPNHHVSHEASLLLEAGGGFVVKAADELEKLWRGWLDDPDSYRRASIAAGDVVKSREGASDRLMELLAPYIGNFEF